MERTQEKKPAMRSRLRVLVRITQNAKNERSKEGEEKEGRRRVGSGKREGESKERRKEEVEEGRGSGTSFLNIICNTTAWFSMTKLMDNARRNPAPSSNSPVCLLSRSDCVLL